MCTLRQESMDQIWCFQCVCLLFIVLVYIFPIHFTSIPFLYLCTKTKRINRIKRFTSPTHSFNKSNTNTVGMQLDSCCKELIQMIITPTVKPIFTSHHPSCSGKPYLHIRTKTCKKSKSFWRQPACFVFCLSTRI